MATLHSETLKYTGLPLYLDILLVLVICGMYTFIVELKYIQKSLFCKILELVCFIFKLVIKVFIVKHLV